MWQIVIQPILVVTELGPAQLSLFDKYFVSHSLLVIRFIQIVIHRHPILQLGICYVLDLKFVGLAIRNFIFTTHSVSYLLIIISSIQILIHRHLIVNLDICYIFHIEFLGIAMCSECTTNIY